MDNRKIEILFGKFNKIGLHYKTQEYPKGSKDKFIIIDNYGYKYTNSYSGLLKNFKRKSKMDKVSCWNPYSIENIKLFLKLNLPYIHLKENNFIKAKSKMLFECDICGEFYSTWDDINHNHGCPQCNLWEKHSDDKVKNKVKEFGNTVGIQYRWIEGEYKRAGLQNLVIQDNLGYKYKTSYNVMDNHDGSKLCRFDYRNPFVLDNIKLYLLKNKPHISIVDKEINCSTAKNPLNFYCKIHKNYFKCILFSLFNRNGCTECGEITKGEQEIIDCLKMNKIKYIYQQRYESLLGLNDGQLSYDFYLPSYNLLIEYQGKQHYEPIEYFGGEEQFEMQVEHDRRKREYAKIHNINLLEIPYWNFDNIKQILENKTTKIVGVGKHASQFIL